MMNYTKNEAERIENFVFLNSSEEIVCSPEFPDGCMELEE